VADPAGATNYMPITADRTKLAASMPDAGNTFAADLVIDQAAAVNYEGGAATFIDGLAAACADLKVTDPTGAINVPFGIKQFSQVAGSRKLILGLGIPSTAPLLSSADTVYRLYRGCTGGTFENKAGVVPVADGFVSYWPMEEATGNLQDWTANANHAVRTGCTQQAGMVGMGQRVLVGQKAVSPNNISLTAYTVLAWAWFDMGNAERFLMSHAPGGTIYNWEYLGQTSPQKYMQLAVGTKYIFAEIPAIAAPHLCAGTRAAGGAAVLYVDGAVAKTGTLDAMACTTGNVLGAYTTGGYGLNDILDEVSIHSVVRSPNWITSYFNMTSANGAFWTVGAEQSCAKPGIRRFNPGLWTPGTNPGVM